MSAVNDIEMESQDSKRDQNENEGTVKQQPLTINHEVSDDPTNATYSFLNEDHTLGNLLRNQIIKNPSVEFCAYSVPHPSEPICNVRIQTAPGVETNTVLKHSLKRVTKICDVLTEKFATSLSAFKEAQSESDE